MNPFDPKSFVDLWTTGTQAMLKAQADAGRAMLGGLHAMASGTVPAELGTAGTDLAQATQSLTEMWTAAGSLFSSLAGRFPAEGGSDAAETTLANILHPGRWMAGNSEMDDVLGRMAEGPRLADLWDVERRYARVMRAWMEVRRRAMEHNAVMLQAWLEAGRAFSGELAGAGGGTPDAKAALALWTEVANRHLLETQRSEPFLQTQAASIRASTELRLAQQELVEHFGKQYGFPTRTELDDVHKTVTELRRELRKLRREMAAKPAVSAPAPIPAVFPKPVIRARGKKR